MKKIRINGAVFFGKGEGKEFLDLPWVKQQIEAKLGFTPYPGTLNIRLTREGANSRKLLEKIQSIKVCPAEGYCTGLIFKAFIGKMECAIIIPQIADYPKDILEIIASSNLRETLQLEDGDEITVTISL